MTPTAAPPTDGYAELAPFYDAFTAASDYEAWTSHVLPVAKAHGLTGTKVLDVACGTGKSLLPFLSHGYEATGCDVSPAMLAEASRKAPATSFVQADMRALPRLGAFDLVTCFDDSLNHVLEEDELGSALRSIAANLAAGGLLLFDLNTLLAYRTTFAIQSVVERPEAIFVCRGESSADATPGCRAAVGVDVFVPRDEALYERLTVRLEQRHYPPHRVTALLLASGLECVAIHGVLDDGSMASEPDETRQLKLLYVARLAKGGDPE
jgi:SAM-dependent methyltransferase